MNPCMDKQYLEKKYLEEGLSTVSIAYIAGVHPSTVLRWLRRFKIPARPPKQKGKKYTPEPEKIRKVREAFADFLENPLGWTDDDIEELIEKAERNKQK